MVLERGGQGFGGARAAAIDQHDERRGGELAVALVTKVVSISFFRPGAEHHRVLGKLGRELHGRAYLPPGLRRRSKMNRLAP